MFCLLTCSFIYLFIHLFIYFRFKIANGGVPFDPPKVEVPKKEPTAPVEKGPSKKCELKNKM